MSRITLASGLVLEDVGSDLMVMIPGSAEVLTLSGEAADVVRGVQSGSPVPNSVEVTNLIRVGVLQAAGLSRRGLIKAGAIGAGAGFGVLALPNASMASSGSSDAIGLNGYWYPASGRLEFVIAEYHTLLANNFPNPVPSQLASDISDLTVTGFGSGSVFASDLDGGTGEDVFWSITTSSTPTPFDVLMGSFTWKGQAFSVSFTIQP